MFGLNVTFKDLAVLFSNKIPISTMGIFLQKQRESSPGPYEVESGQSVHSVLEIISRRGHKALFLKKSFGLKREISSVVLLQLAKDYFKHAQSLDYLGLGPLVKNYRLRVNLDDPRPTMSVEQLFFPFGTARQWLENPNTLRVLSAELFCSYLVPLIRNANPEGSADCPAFVDLSFKNLAVVPVDSHTLKLHYFDFFPPRIRMGTGAIDDRGYQNFHIRTPMEIEYRFFNLIGIVHNVLNKSLVDIGDSRTLASIFIREAKFWMDPILRVRFGIDVGSLLDLDFVTAANRFLSKDRGEQNG